MLDWVRYSAGRSSWFAGDGLHLAPAGARAFTRLLSTAFEWTRLRDGQRHLDAHARTGRAEESLSAPARRGPATTPARTR